MERGNVEKRVKLHAESAMNQRHAEDVIATERCVHTMGDDR